MTSLRPEHRVGRSATVAIDLVLVLVFCVLGRLSHAESVFEPVGLAQTSWPFLAGTAIAHLGLWIARRPAGSVGSGVVAWLSTVVGGLALRALIGQGTAVAFIIVATLTLGVFLVGWRLIARAVSRRRD